jgi:hypothetical protein
MRTIRFSSSIMRWAALTAALTSYWTPGRASAADIAEPDLTAAPRPRPEGPVNLLPVALAARVSRDRVTATTWAGYDGAKGSPLLTATVEARLVGGLALLIGAGYTAEVPGSPAVRPQIGLHAQLLDQARSGIDGGVAVMYRQDQFTEEGGFFQGAVAVERQDGRVRVIGNLVYGQDGEGDDRDAEARLAALVQARRHLRVGLDGRYRRALWSSDPNRIVRNRPEYELVAGPTVAYALGSWALMAETGISVVRTTATQTGAIALAGLASSF